MKGSFDTQSWIFICLWRSISFQITGRVLKTQYHSFCTNIFLAKIFVVPTHCTFLLTDFRKYKNRPPAVNVTYILIIVRCLCLKKATDFQRPLSISVFRWKWDNFPLTGPSPVIKISSLFAPSFRLKMEKNSVTVTLCVLKPERMYSKTSEICHEYRNILYRYALLNDGMRSEKCVVRRFRRCASVCLHKFR
jgi:hypothetical protein